MCVSTTDVCVYDANYTGTFWNTHYGRAVCVVASGTDRCDRFAIEYDTSWLSGYDLTKLRRAGCHEFGHTTGLKHPDGIHSAASCMFSSITNPSQSIYYSTSDLAHVNGKY